MQVLQNSNISPFLQKLWKMVNDPSTDNLIYWSPAGNTFIIQNQVQFWYDLVPLYFKHNNMSSFVRQLNLYGFHKISSLENPSAVANTEKDDANAIQFYHPHFQKDKPDKLKFIKRKSVGSKSHDVQSVIRQDDLNKVLTDVKQLRGRQTSVDSQLSAMKQENAVLWRELAILRQKHMKQQQIVNKLIQFLVTLVQPSASPRMGVGVKRRMPLMLHENPSKRVRARKNGRQYTESGPTIHELDPEVDLLPEQLLEEASVIEEDIPLIDSPVTPSSQLAQDSITSQSVTSPMMPNQNIPNIATNQQARQTENSSFWDKPEFVSIENASDGISDNEEELINTLRTNTANTEKVFLNPNNRDALIGSLTSPGSSNVNASRGKSIDNNSKQTANKQIANASRAPGMQVATKSPKISSGTRSTNECFREDLDLHLGSTQNELDQLKEILNGCNTLDANGLFGLFSEGESDCGIRNTLQNRESPEEVSGNEVVTAASLMSFNELFDDDDDDDDLNSHNGTTIEYNMPSETNGLNTPVIIKNEPKFPTNT